MESFEELDLAEPLHRAVKACGFEKPTPVQARAIPVILEGKDLMASALTGTGKTAAFVLPAMQQLLTRPRSGPGGGKGPRVLILTPTRELAEQVGADNRDLGRFAGLRTGSVIGGAPFQPQIRLLQKPIDILVATPGRLMDHMGSGRLDYRSLDLFVLDEADRMLDMGFIDDIRLIVSRLPRKRQTLLFSATLEDKVLTIAHEVLRKPERIQLTTVREKHDLIDQKIFHADDFLHKHRLLDSYLKRKDLTQALIFTATRHSADRLAGLLEAQGHDSAAIHGDLPQKERKKAMNRMKQGKLRILVATDVAARGIDIKGVSHVINFELPYDAENYIHRIGRTGRAGETGQAVSLVTPEDWGKLREIERLTGKPLERDVIPGMEPVRIAPSPATRPPRHPLRRRRRGRSRLRR